MTSTSHISATEQSKQVKLPFWRTVGQAYAIWAKSLTEIIRISWLWLVLMTPVVFVASWLLNPILSEMRHAASVGKVMPRSADMLQLAQLILMLIYLPMLASIAVAWHRLVLRDENVAGSRYLRLDRVVLVYAALLLLIMLLPTMPQYLANIYAGGAPDTPAMGSVLASFGGSFLMFAGFYAAARISIALPARALERSDITLGRAWKETHGNGWRLFWGHLLCLLPFSVISGAGAWWLPAISANRAVSATGSVLLAYITLSGGLIAVGFLSLAYRHFLEEAPREG